MPQAHLIVCERKTHWAVGLRRLLVREISMRQTRSLDECFAELNSAPASVVFLEMALDDVEALLDALADWTSEFPLARLLVMGERKWQPFELLVREAGALDFITSGRRLALAAGMARRHFESLPETMSDPAQRIWSSLPWAAYAAAGQET